AGCWGSRWPWSGKSVSRPAWVERSPLPEGRAPSRRPLLFIARPGAPGTGSGGCRVQAGGHCGAPPPPLREGGGLHASWHASRAAGEPALAQTIRGPPARRDVGWSAAPGARDQAAGSRVHFPLIVEAVFASNFLSSR